MASLKEKINVIALFILVFTSASSCTYVEQSGKMTRMTGEYMEEYSNQHKGFIGEMAGFGGKINKAVGTNVENISKNDRSRYGDNAAEQYINANSEVIDTAYESVE